MIEPELKSDKKKKINTERITIWFIIVVTAFAVLVLLSTAKSMFFTKAVAVDEEPIQSGHFGAGGFTEYDLALAKRLMDKDGDGKCDVCGMDINSCIESGQLQCNMGGNTDKLNIGVLDKTKQKHHYHADLKVYINGEEIDFAQEKYFVKSRFIHVENDVQGDTGKVLHMHATGVPLWIFFESTGMKFEKDCLTLDTGEKYCNSNNKILRFYVNGKPNEEFGDYIFQDNDRILISYDLAGKDIKSQIDSVTSFSPDH